MGTTQSEEPRKASGTWIRDDRIGPDTPRAWKNPHLLYAEARRGGLSGDEPLEGRLKPLLRPGSNELDRRETLVASEAWMHTHPKMALDVVADLLELRDSPDWREMRPALSFILRQFYEESGDCIALINVESIREPIGGRLPGYREIIRPNGGPKFLYRPRVRGRLDLEQGVSVPAEWLRWVIPNDRRHFELEVTRLLMKREFTSGAVYKFFSTYWFLSNRTHDRPQIDAAAIPLYDRTELPNKLKRHRLIVFAKLDPGTGFVSTYAFDLNAESGAIYSIRYGQNSLALWSAMDTWLDEMVSKRLSAR